MRTIAHISDLHFGREDNLVKEGLLKDLDCLNPHLIVISGDFTQRGRVSQYMKAGDFLKSLKHKYLAVPGNHDIPLFDIFTRFFFPLNRFRRFISKENSPYYIDEEMAVLSINTARSLTWKNGRISIEQIKHIEEVFSKADNSLFKVLVTHHPFIPPPGNPGIRLVGRSKRAMNVIERTGIDLLLSGHLHLGYSGDIRTYYRKNKRSLISVQAGTAISKRRRNEANGYNLITFENDDLTIVVRSWKDGSFEESRRTAYKCVNGIWQIVI